MQNVFRVNGPILILQHHIEKETITMPAAWHDDGKVAYANEYKMF